MTQRTDAQLKTDGTTYINNNTTGDVTPADVRTVLDNVIDSKLNNDKFTSNTIIYASVSATPLALTVAEKTVVGRGSGSAISALVIDTNLSGTFSLNNSLPSSKAVKTLVNNVALKASGTSQSLGTNDDVEFNSVNLNTIKLSSTQVYACRAWVNFNGNVDNNVTATYVRTGTTVVVTLNNHGYLVGHQVYCDFTSGSASDGEFTITTKDANTFTFIHGSSGNTSGNVTLNRRLIRAGGNVHSVTYNGNADYTINFSIPMIDANYVYSGVTQNSSGNTVISGKDGIIQTNLNLRVLSCGFDGNFYNRDYIMLEIFR
jgi:hypothetical protein